MSSRQALGFNEIGSVTVEAKRPLFFDPYEKNRATGAFILIDPLTNETLAAGMITGAAAGERHPAEDQAALELSTGRVTPAERYIRAGHRPVALWLVGHQELAYVLERKLFDRGCLVHVAGWRGNRGHNEGIGGRRADFDLRRPRGRRSHS